MALEIIALWVVFLCAIAYKDYRHGTRTNELIDALQVKDTLHEQRTEKLINAIMARHLPEKAFSALVEKQDVPHTEDYRIMEDVLPTPETPTREEPIRPIDLSERTTDISGFGGI